MEYYHLHPIAVHFPIVLLIVGLAVETIAIFKPENEWLKNSSSWLLWLGTLAAWVAVGTGLLAEETAPHVPLAWEVLAEHETLAFWTAGLFSMLSVGRIIFRNRWKVHNKSLRLIYVFFWLISAGMLVGTADHGGQLVFDFGVGVVKHK